MEEDCVRTVLQWPEPKSIQDIQVFLGFANFYRSFIQCYSKIVRLLLQLKGGPKANGKPTFNQQPACPDKSARQAFKELKIAFTKAPVLAHYHFKRPC